MEKENDKKMTEEDLESLLYNVLDELVYAEEDAPFQEFDGGRIYTFSDKGVLTYNKGLVIQFSTGEEFQLTIVRSN